MLYLYIYSRIVCMASVLHVRTVPSTVKTIAAKALWTSIHYAILDYASLAKANN